MWLSWMHCQAKQATRYKPHTTQVWGLYCKQGSVIYGVHCENNISKMFIISQGLKGD